MDFIQHMPQEKPIWFDDALKFYVNNILNPEKEDSSSEKEDSSSEKEDSSSEKDFPEWFAPFAERISKLENKIDDEQDSSIKQNLKLMANYMNKLDDLRVKDDMIQSLEKEIDDQKYTIKSLKRDIDYHQYTIKSHKTENERRDKIVSDVYNKLNKFYGIINDTRRMDRSTSSHSIASSVGSN